MSLRDTTPATLEPDAPRPPRRWRRRLRRLLYRAAVVLVLLVLGLLGVSQTSWFRDWLRRDIIVRAERLLDAKVSIARVGGDLFTGIVLDGVRLEQGGVPVIAIERIRVTYRVLGMRKTHITLDTVDVLRPVILARQTAEGWTFARLVKPRVKPTGSQPIVFAIDALRLYDGRVTVEPLQPGKPTRIADLDAHLAISTGPGGAGSRCAPCRSTCRIGRCASGGWSARSKNTTPSCRSRTSASTCGAVISASTATSAACPRRPISNSRSAPARSRSTRWPGSFLACRRGRCRRRSARQCEGRSRSWRRRSRSGPRPATPSAT